MCKENIDDMSNARGTSAVGVIGEGTHIMGIYIVKYTLRAAEFRIVSLRGADIAGAVRRSRGGSEC